MLTSFFHLDKMVSRCIRMKISICCFRPLRYCGCLLGRILKAKLPLSLDACSQWAVSLTTQSGGSSALPEGLLTRRTARHLWVYGHSPEGL